MPDDLRVVAEVLLKEIEDGAAGPETRVLGPVINFRDTGGDDPPRAHGAGFQRNIESRVLQPPVAVGTAGVLNGQKLGVGQGIVVLLPPVAAPAKNLTAFIHDDTAHRHLPGGGGFFGQDQGLAHIGFVVLSHGRCLPVVVRFCHCTEFFTGWQGEAGGGRPLSFVPAPRACRAAR